MQEGRTVHTVKTTSFSVATRTIAVGIFNAISLHRCKDSWNSVPFRFVRTLASVEMEAASLLRKVENNSGTAGAVERFMIELCVADEVWPLYSLLTVIFERTV
jgi:hypothetical protein